MLDGQPLMVDSPLYGQHQQRNIALATAAAVALRNSSSSKSSLVSNIYSYNISNANIEAGIRSTWWPGRLELLAGTSPQILLDVAHNPAGAWALRAAIAHLPESRPRTLIFSCLRDKSLTEMARILLPLFDSSPDGSPSRPLDHIIFAPIDSPRAASVESLLTTAHELSIPAHAAPHVAGALAQARRVTPPDGIIIATGSILSDWRTSSAGIAAMSQNQAENRPVPPPKKPAIRWLTYLLLIPLIALATASFGCISLVCGLWDKSGLQQHAVARAWAKVLLLLSLSSVELVGADKLRQHRVAVYVSNHLSYYDTPALFAKLPFQFRILAKQSLWKIPFIGWYLNRSGQVPIDASSGPIGNCRSAAGSEGVAVRNVTDHLSGGRPVSDRSNNRVSFRRGVYGSQGTGPTNPTYADRDL